MNIADENYFEDFDLDKVSKTTPLCIELSRLVGKLDPDGEMRAGGPSLDAVQRAWSEIAGDQVASITRSVYLRGNELVVILSAPNWAQELSFLSGEYCEKLNEVLGISSLEKVSFRARYLARLKNP